MFMELNCRGENKRNLFIALLNCKKKLSFSTKIILNNYMKT